MTPSDKDDSPTSKKQKKIEELMSDRTRFDQHVYTPLQDAVAELKRRHTNSELEKYLEEKLPAGIPEIMKDSKSVAIFRHIATPNHEIRRFIILSDLIKDSAPKELDIHLRPLILEYLEDKFTNRNEWKYSLGRIYLYRGMDKHQQPVFESEYAVDFNTSNGKPISSLATLWGQSLVDFHHELFTETFPSMRGNVFDLSAWVKQNGHDPKAYYKFFLSLFLKHGILMENFLLETTESSFTKDVILPTIMEIEEETGMKPLIVALEPTEIEKDRFWLSHPYEETKKHIQKKKGDKK